MLTEEERDRNRAAIQEMSVAQAEQGISVSDRVVTRLQTELDAHRQAMALIMARRHHEGELLPHKFMIESLSGQKADAEWSRTEYLRRVEELRRGPCESTGQRAARRRGIINPLLTGKGWTRNKWATMAGVEFKTADKYLKGVGIPTPSTRKWLAEALGISPADFPD